MSCIRYSPNAIESYGAPTSSSNFLKDDHAAWNLAYLSWDFDKCKTWPDPNFSTHVRRTLQFVIATGGLDLTDDVNVYKKVRCFLLGPAPAAAYQINNMQRVTELPLYLAYGEAWLARVNARARNYREPHDERFDCAIDDLSMSCEVIRACKIR